MARRLRNSCFLFALIAITALVAADYVPSSTASGNAPSNGTQVAARWYHNARQGRLNYRATAAGRRTPHRVLPQSVEPRATSTVVR